MKCDGVLFAVVGHHARTEQAERLAESLNAHLFLDAGSHGAGWNHCRAIEWAKQQNRRVVILEDDAVPVPGFSELVVYWLNRFPDSLISFYLGTGRPPQYQIEIAALLIQADKQKSDHIRISRLLHAVCYSIPPNKIARVLDNWNPKKPADYAIGDAIGESVVYPVYSLTDHLDDETIEQHPDRVKRTERRKAWRLWKEGNS